MSSTIRALYLLYVCVQHDMPCMCTLVHYTTSITIHAPDDGEKTKNSLLRCMSDTGQKSKRRNSLFTDLPASTHFAAGCFDLKLAVNTNVGPRCCVL